MTLRAVARRRAIVAVLTLAPTLAYAQRGGRAPLEFTQQQILVANFQVSDKPTRADFKFGRKR